MKKITTDELMAAPIGTIFYERDLPELAIFEKTADTRDDIRVCGLSPDAEQCRLGIREMDDCDRRSKQWGVLEHADIVAMIERLSSAIGAADGGVA